MIISGVATIRSYIVVYTYPWKRGFYPLASSARVRAWRPILFRFLLEDGQSGNVFSANCPPARVPNKGSRWPSAQSHPRAHRLNSPASGRLLRGRWAAAWTLDRGGGERRMRCGGSKWPRSAPRSNGRTPRPSYRSLDNNVQSAGHKGEQDTWAITCWARGHPTAHPILRGCIEKMRRNLNKKIFKILYPSSLNILWHSQ